MCFKPRATDNESQRDDNAGRHFPILVFPAHIYDSYKKMPRARGVVQALALNLVPLKMSYKLAGSQKSQDNLNLRALLKSQQRKCRK